jgi:hypothetical protein
LYCENQIEKSLATACIAEDKRNKSTKADLIDVFGHRTKKMGHPVSSAGPKLRIAQLVLQWETMWEP